MNTVSRATAYAALAEIFRPPSKQPAESNSAGELLAALETLDGSLAQQWRTALASGREEPSTIDLAQIYNRLFVGPMPPLAHPYESVYRTPGGRLMGEVTMIVIRAYAEAGLVLADDCRDLPDHVSVELEFMAFLAIEEAAANDDNDQALEISCLTRQVSFLRNHLVHWIPYFCHRVISAEPESFYGRAAVILAAFVVSDLDRTMEAWHYLAPPVTPVTDLHVERQVGVWKVALRDERPFPCTLCGICTEVCRPNAVRLIKSEWKSELFFDPASCNGCGYCVKFCPERILRVESMTTNGSENPKRRLAASAIAPCVKCGMPLIAEVMLNRILERFRCRKGKPADEEAMHLCHACKVGLTIRSNIP